MPNCIWHCKFIDDVNTSSFRSNELVDRETEREERYLPLLNVEWTKYELKCNDKIYD